MQCQIRCKVYPGQFPSEYAVKARQADDEAFSLFAPVTAVETDEPPTRERAVDGWLTVAVWENLGEKLIVRLPRESFEAGRYVTVSVTQLKSRPAAVEV